MSQARNMTWEADVFDAPMLVRDQERVYKSRMVLIVDSASGYVLVVRAFPRQTSPLQALEDALVTSIRKHRTTPKILRVRDAKTADGLNNLAQTFSLTIRHGGRLPALTIAKRSLTATLKKERKGT